MRTLIAAVILSLLAAPMAGAAPKAKTEEPAVKIIPYVNIDPVALPVISNGRVVNYVFVTMRVDLSASANTDLLRTKEPFFRDALVRLGHRAPFNSPPDFVTVDEARLCAAYLAEARAIAGAGAVTGVRIIQQVPKSTRVAAGG